MVQIAQTRFAIRSHYLFVSWSVSSYSWSRSQVEIYFHKYWRSISDKFFKKKKDFVMRAVRIMLMILLLKVTVVTLYVLFEKNVCDWYFWRRSTTRALALERNKKQSKNLGLYDDIREAAWGRLVKLGTENLPNRGMARRLRHLVYIFGPNCWNVNRRLRGWRDIFRVRSIAVSLIY